MNTDVVERVECTWSPASDQSKPMSGQDIEACWTEDYLKTRMLQASCPARAWGEVPPGLANAINTQSVLQSAWIGHSGPCAVVESCAGAPLDQITRAFMISNSTLADVLGVHRSSLLRHVQKGGESRRSRKIGMPFSYMLAAADLWLSISSGRQMDRSLVTIKLGDRDLAHAIASNELSFPALRDVFDELWRQQSSGHTVVSSALLDEMVNPNEDDIARQLRLKRLRARLACMPTVR